jgi:hypothetical protein
MAGAKEIPMLNKNLGRSFFTSMFQSMSPSMRCLHMLTVLFLTLCFQVAWSQAAPPFTISGSIEYSSVINGNTGPGVTEFNGQILTAWCDNSTGHLYSSLQSSPTATPTVYQSSIVCPYAQTGISLAVYNSQVYAASQFLPGKLAISSDGMNWTGYNLNVTNDTVFSWGLGIYAFDGQLYLAYDGQQGVSVASSSDGINYSFVASVSSYPLNADPSGWLQSPALFQWNGVLYVGYLTTGGVVVVGHSTNQNASAWSTQEYTTTILKRDLVLVPHDNALYFAGQSYYSENNLWMAGAYDGVSFPAATNYGGAMSTSPSAVDFNGTFYMVIRSGYGANMWNFYAND